MTAECPAIAGTYVSPSQRKSGRKGRGERCAWHNCLDLKLSAAAITWKGKVLMIPTPPPRTDTVND